MQNFMLFGHLESDLMIPPGGVCTHCSSPFKIDILDPIEKHHSWICQCKHCVGMFLRAIRNDKILLYYCFCVGVLIAQLDILAHWEHTQPILVYAKHFLGIKCCPKADA